MPPLHSRCIRIDRFCSSEDLVAISLPETWLHLGISLEYSASKPPFGSLSPQWWLTYWFFAGVSPCNFEWIVSPTNKTKTPLISRQLKTTLISHLFALRNALARFLNCLCLDGHKKIKVFVFRSSVFGLRFVDTRSRSSIAPILLWSMLLHYSHPTDVWYW